MARSGKDLPIVVGAPGSGLPYCASNERLRREFPDLRFTPVGHGDRCPLRLVRGEPGGRSTAPPCRPTSSDRPDGKDRTSMATRVADYIFAFLADRGVRTCSWSRAAGRCSWTTRSAARTGLRPVCCHHEQAAAMAAEAHARISGLPGVAVRHDRSRRHQRPERRVRCLDRFDPDDRRVRPGQARDVRRPPTRAWAMRQLGDQEADIVGLVRGITKFARSIDEPDRGPVLPGACLVRGHERQPRAGLARRADRRAVRRRSTPSGFAGFAAAGIPAAAADDTLSSVVRDVAAEAGRGARPVLLAGTGVRLAGALDAFEAAVERLGIPVTTAWTHDLIASDDPHFCGRQGTIGTRAGNFTVQNADLLLVVGARLTVRQVGYNWQAFAPRRSRSVVDVTRPSSGGRSCASTCRSRPTPGASWPRWTDALDGAGYPSRAARRVAGLVPAAGRALPARATAAAHEPSADQPVPLRGERCSSTWPRTTSWSAAMRLRRSCRSRRLACSAVSGCSRIPAPRAWATTCRRRLVPPWPGDERRASVVCLAGDGSLQMNIQELQTLRHHQLPVKLFVMDNGGYLSIRSTQQNFFGGTIGSGPGDGVCFPDYVAVAAAYGIQAVRTRSSRAHWTRPSPRCSRPRGRFCATSCWTRTQGFEPRVRVARDAGRHDRLAGPRGHVSRSSIAPRLARNMPSLQDDPAGRAEPVSRRAAGIAALEGVLFDLDGTLVDTRPGIEGGPRAAFAEITGSDLGLRAGEPQPAARRT